MYWYQIESQLVMMCNDVLRWWLNSLVDWGPFWFCNGALKYSLLAQADQLGIIGNLHFSLIAWRWVCLSSAIHSSWILTIPWYLHSNKKRKHRTSALERSAFKSLEDKNLLLTQSIKPFFLSEARLTMRQYLIFRTLFQTPLADEYILMFS